MHFFVDKEELARFDAWIAVHDKICPYYDDGTSPESKSGAIGGRISWKFTPNSLAVVVQVQCACGGAENLTDYSHW
jgi:hypothetical protein